MYALSPRVSGYSQSLPMAWGQLPKGNNVTQGHLLGPSASHLTSLTTFSLSVTLSVSMRVCVGAPEIRHHPEPVCRVQQR